MQTANESGYSPKYIELKSSRFLSALNINQPSVIRVFRELHELVLQAVCPARFLILGTEKRSIATLIEVSTEAKQKRSKLGVLIDDGQVKWRQA